MTLHTTFALARKHGACKGGYKAMAEALGGVMGYGRDTPIPLLRVALEGRSPDDAMWCLRAVLPDEEAERDRIARLLVCDYAEHVLAIYEALYPDDPRPRQCIEVSRRYANGEATIEELMVAGVAAKAASGAAWAASKVAGAAAEAAWAATEAAGAAERQWQLERFLELVK